MVFYNLIYVPEAQISIHSARTQGDHLQMDSRNMQATRVDDAEDGR